VALTDGAPHLVDDDARILDDVLPSEPKNDPTVGRQRCVALTVALKGNRIAMEREAIEFDDDATGKVAEVDDKEPGSRTDLSMHLKAVDGFRSEQVGEQRFELRVGHLPFDEPSFEDCAEGSEPPAAMTAPFGAPRYDRRNAEEMSSNEVIQARLDDVLGSDSTKFAYRLERA
jgi:hypothetical protein